MMPNCVACGKPAKYRLSNGTKERDVCGQHATHGAYVIKLFDLSVDTDSDLRHAVYPCHDDWSKAIELVDQAIVNSDSHEGKA